MTGDFHQPHMTKALPPTLQSKVDDSFVGMASWADKSIGHTCRLCEHYALDTPPYATRSTMKYSKGELKNGYCRKYIQLVGQRGAKFPWRAWACRYFKENPEPPKPKQP